MPSNKSKKNMNCSNGKKSKKSKHQEGKNKSKPTGGAANNLDSAGAGGDGKVATETSTDDQANNNVDKMGGQKMSARGQGEGCEDVQSNRRRQQSVSEPNQKGDVLEVVIPTPPNANDSKVDRCRPEGASTGGLRRMEDASPLKTLKGVSSQLSADAPPFELKQPAEHLPRILNRSEVLPKEFLKGKAAMPSKETTSSESSKETSVDTGKYNVKVPIGTVALKHPLLHSWTLWYLGNDNRTNWLENLKEVLTVKYVEDFWSLYHHIILPSELKQSCDYSLFKKGIRPMWEDKRNVRGGRWVICNDKKTRKELLDNRWLEVMLLLIGEAIDANKNGKFVNGAVVCARNKGDKIGIWLEVSDTRIVMEVGVEIKQLLELKETINFENHEDTMKKTGSTTKPALKL